MNPRYPLVLLLLVPLLACGDGVVTAPDRDPVSPVPGISITCRLGTAGCASVMQGQILSFSATRVGVGVRSATLDFGDGESAELGTLAEPVTVQHAYARTGTFTARLLATDTAGGTLTATEQVTVGTLVTASIGARALGGLQVTATADIRGARATLYVWTFDPQVSPTVTTEPHAQYLYPSPGWKAVELRATLEDGRTVSASSSVVVE